MRLIKEMPLSERPREKAVRCGIRTLSNRELLAVILRTGSRGMSAAETAEELLEKAGSIGRLARMRMEEIMEIKGISTVKALQLLSCFELSRRCALESTQNVRVADDPARLAEWLKSEIGSSWQEQFLVVYLDAALHVISYRTLFVGTIDASAVFPREIFKEALLLNSTDVILVHNHPSGELAPSVQDIYMTKRIVSAGKLMGITVLDHLIITQSDFFSFERQGIMEECVEGNRKD